MISALERINQLQDDAGFGRINKSKYCWCRKGKCPSVPCHHIREYRYAYEGVDSRTGDGFFLVLPYCNTDCMNAFLEELSNAYPNDGILLICAGVGWYKSNGLKKPTNIHIAEIPTFTPEMNPI